MSFVLQLFGESSYSQSGPKILEGGGSLGQWDHVPTLNREIPGLNPLNRALRLNSVMRLPVILPN